MRSRVAFVRTEKETEKASGRSDWQIRSENKSSLRQRVLGLCEVRYERDECRPFFLSLSFYFFSLLVNSTERTRVSPERDAFLSRELLIAQDTVFDELSAHAVDSASLFPLSFNSLRKYRTNNRPPLRF